MARPARVITAVLVAAICALVAAPPCASATPHRRHHASHGHHRPRRAGHRRGRAPPAVVAPEALPAPPPSGLGPSSPSAAVVAPLPSGTVGSLVVAVAQASDVTIDGRAYGRTPTASIELPAGPHVVVIRNGERRWVHTVHFDLAPGERREISVDLDAI